MTKRVLVTYPNGTECVTEVVQREDYAWVRGHGELARLIDQQQCTVVPLVPLTDDMRKDIWSLVSCVSIVYHRKNIDYADLEHVIKAEHVEKWLKAQEGQHVTN